ncbi:ABC transporter ATP-binding protein [uncultured Gemmiger sp.]|uniref:ABC transporter ATP-binding protein n=1 Tax=uncultured Gemmiger sp. TaxID=1623490 RepID=UPI0025E3C0B4|nr:ABC transporter ATP-binding protein [uncultured Gemmiger sp.]
MTDTQTPALTPENDVILQVKDLQVEYRTDDATIYAVNGVDLTVRRNMTVGLVGETGAGKTTTALSIMNLIPDQVGVITGGAIELEGKDVLSMDDSEMNAIRGKDVAMIFQDPMTALNPVFTVGDQIAETLMIHEHLDKKEALEKAGRMLETVGIPAERAKEYPSQFSGGMKQRVVIAIGLACNPKLLIADEPTTALDVTIQAQVLEIMQDLKETYKMGLIMITHDLGIVAEICDEVAVMYAGRIVEYGTLEDVFEHTLHPYTEGLFNSLPNINDRRHQLTPIPGLMPDPSKLPEGCAFAPRCRYATDACRAKQPQKRWVSSTHYVACSAYDDPAFHIERKEG